MASLNSPVRQKTMITWGFEVYVGADWSSLTRIWVFKDQDIQFGGENQEDTYTNFYTKKVTAGDQVNFAFSYHEMRPEIIDVINGGLSQRINNGGILIPSQTDTFEPGDWALDDEIRVTLSNGDNTVVTMNSINGTVDGVNPFWGLTAWVDYDISTNVFGRTILVLKTGWVFTTNDQVITLDYDVTPAKGDYFTEIQSGIPVWFICMLRRKGTDPATGDAMVYELELENTTNDKNYPGLIGDRDESTAGLPCAFSGFVVPNGQRFLNFQA